ncbi:superinfection immunity protein [Pseudomonas fulva]|uniref:superinfection immunity protein n=1 Tax=Pseudomonas fulva TaxID=47880 RepID=UPI000F7AD8F3|nr:superinfection immunity protein [Pseudomonas fulva]MBA1217275.1 superinfection immunity protein [Pseudomonas fulva]MDH0571047.1 superinfection immunity protein [Pseudomonas fulva]RRW63383.1 superinfection immunity protein [Pseudomonas fulva]
MAADVNTYMGIGTTVTAALIYFTPAVIAWIRRHPNRVSIFLLNLMLGWTFIGWLVALIWSASAIRRRSMDEPSNYPGPPPIDNDSYRKLEQLADLKERGHLTQDEFDEEKRRVLKDR